MKGFVHTLEAVIASTLILTMMIVVLPETTQENDFELDRVNERLDDLLKRGELQLDPVKIEADIQDSIPGIYNHSVELVKMNSNFTSLKSPENQYFNGSGSADIQIWIENPENLNISFSGEKIVENLSSSGYVQRNLEENTGWLNSTGTGNLSVSFNTYIEEGSIPDSDEVFTRNFPAFKNSSYEIRVAAYR